MKKQDGFVSIIMALMIMVFVTLIALGFAFVARQNQSQSQNRVLSTQAFYAAESGVNDAIKYLQDQLTNTGTTPADVTNCTNAPIPGSTDTVGSINSQVKYTCVLYNTTPTSLEYSLGSEASRTIRLQSQNGPLRSVTISWQDSSGNDQFATNSQHWLPQKAFGTDTANATNGNNLFTGTGILRATLVPVYNPITRTDLTTRSQTLFLYPKAGNTPNTPGTQDFLTAANQSDANQGVFVDGNCNSTAAQTLPKYCSVTINNLNRFGGTSTFYLRLRSLYRASNVSISGIADNSQPARLMNEQAVIDATGKASDVLRRIQVRVPLSINTVRPEFAIETIDSMCKRLEVWPGGGNVDAPAGVGGTPAACDPTN